MDFFWQNDSKNSSIIGVLNETPGYMEWNPKHRYMQLDHCLVEFDHLVIGLNSS